ncbi:MAG TPA: hypothetical protein VK190_09675 [Pseudoneobacillus sp.]|nr:hypothetical protein [Pseudoneobacillus sp.]
MMGFSVSLTVFIFITTIVLSSCLFYKVELKTLTNKVMKDLSLKIVELDFSFEQMVYFISLPSNLPVIKMAKKEDLSLELEYSSLFFPRLTGVKIYIQTNDEYVILSYLPIKDFRLPKLDQLLESGKINQTDYFNISSTKLMHPSTLNQIKDEVYKQLQLGKGIGLGKP